MVQAATAPVPTQRLTTVSEFVEMLEEVENELTAPPSTSVHPEEPEPEETDPLEARGGDLVGEWKIKKRLGTGSTCRAFLAHNERTGKDEVLKVGLSDEKGARLAHEARVLRPLTDSRVIRLARPEPLQIANRTVIVLEHAGELTLARKLRDDGRLTVDELETYSDYLFGALDYLEGEGVYHRDIKPDNIAIRVRPNRTRQLVLFDFSLAGVSVKELTAGTPRYLDPFLGTASRQVYDKHAEWYALAVTLHEMASGELPIWGDGGTEPQLTDGPPVLAVEAFDPAIRDGLVEFFHQALHRDHRRRFASLKDMRDAWQQVFRRSDASAPVGTDHPEIEADEPDEQAAAKAREEAAAKATRATALEAAGLTPRAVSAAHRLDATTVGELLTVANKLAHLPGLGAKTRQELQRRVKEWRTRLGSARPFPPRPPPGRKPPPRWPPRPPPSAATPIWYASASTPSPRSSSRRVATRRTWKGRGCCCTCQTPPARYRICRCGRSTRSSPSGWTSRRRASRRSSANNASAGTACPWSTACVPRSSSCCATAGG